VVSIDAKVRGWNCDDRLEVIVNVQTHSALGKDWKRGRGKGEGKEEEEERKAFDWLVSTRRIDATRGRRKIMTPIRKRTL
jgi:hypothetical protein